MVTPPNVRTALIIAQAANRLRDEIWQGMKEPYVGVLVNWDNECIWSAVSVSTVINIAMCRFARARCRPTLIVATSHGNVMASDLRNGLIDRYRTIYLPTQLSVNRDLMEILTDYVKRGGRLVTDAPSFWFDERGKCLPTDTGSDFEQLFGVQLRDFQYANNTRYKLHGEKLDGWVCDLKLPLPRWSPISITASRPSPSTNWARALRSSSVRKQAIVL